MKNLKVLFTVLCMLGTISVWGASTTEELTNAELKTNVTRTICAYATAKNYTDGTVSYVFQVYTDAASRPWVQLTKDAGRFIKITTPENTKITSVVVTITSATNSSGGVADISKHTAYASRIALLTSDAAGSTSMTGAAYTTSVSNNTMTLSPTGTDRELYLKVASGARIWGMSVTYESTGSTKTSV